MRILALLPLLALLAACGGETDIRRHRIAVFGTETTLTIRSSGTVDTAAVVTRVDRELQRLHRDWHAWEPGMLGEINRAIAAGNPIALSPQAVRVIEEAAQLERRSGGRFNPAIGRLLALWGFHASSLPEGPPPPSDEIERLVALSPSMSDLDIRDGTLTSRNPAVQLDFGAYLKGLAVERALQILAEAGIEHAIVNAGGDLGAIGRRGHRPWRAAVAHPDGEGGRYLGTVEVNPGEFVFTSGNYRRYRQHEGVRHGHILDPRDGYPADHVSSVTVIHGDGGEADAAATALAVAGTEEWPVVAAGLGVDAVLRVEADGSITATTAMASRVTWQGRPGKIRVVSLP
ncbi:FAD:protein FMN transferase [Wenzhouxiangella sediminis]|uniref:FAD:protein FMN transferase n=1 Tax=Wenzhouxiangella sediminis TaxID=1792836 RepID=UPI0015F26388|nr:FAD:protein FMN transferase [Wenzhouxiangella sediminis]